VEGRKGAVGARSDGLDNATGQPSPTTGFDRESDADTVSQGEDTTAAQERKAAGPGGKGHGNRWLYVSHEPVPAAHLTSPGPLELHELFKLEPQSSPSSTSASEAGSRNLSNREKPSPRLVKLSFSPLILHILCANLHAAKGLLAAAINAGFRESGVQSLKALDDQDAGVMVGIRTAGLGFESVVGVVEEGEGGGQEVYTGLVDEGYLRMCVGVVNERFEWNGERRERLRRELRGLKDLEEKEGKWEDKGVRRERMKAEGLKRREMREGESGSKTGHDQAEGEDVLGNGLFLNAS